MASRSSSAPMAARATLPNEVIGLIIKHLPRDDLSHARHISKAFAAVAAPRLFETIPIWIGRDSLQALTELSRHPQLRQYVTEVVFSPLRFIDQKDETTYLSRTKASIRLNTDSSNLADLKMMKHKTAYRSFIESQRELTADGFDLSILAHAFKQLPSLKRLVLDHTNTKIGAKLLHRELGFFNSSILLTCDCLYTLPVLVRALCIGNVQLECFTIGSSTAFSKCKSYEVSLVTRDSNYSMLKPQYPKTIVSAALAKAFDLTYVDDICESNEYLLFRDLRRLEIQDLDRIPSEEAVMQIRIALNGILSLPDKLESIKIGNLGLNNGPDLCLYEPLHLNGGGLRHLDLSYSKAKRRRLMEFLGDRSLCLESIKFFEVILANASWATVLAELRMLEFPNLKTFILHNCRDPDQIDDEIEWVVAVQDYVLRKTLANPCAQHW